MQLQNGTGGRQGGGWSSEDKIGIIEDHLAELLLINIREQSDYDLVGNTFSSIVQMKSIQVDSTRV